MKLNLRAYQVEAIAATFEARDRGVRKQLGVAATGLGKTVMFCALAEQMGGRTLILAHRDELVNQAVAKVHEVWGETVDVGVVKAERDEYDAQVVVASVQTLSRASRLARLVAPSMLRPIEGFDLVVVDEAHHATADSYRRVLEGLNAGESDGPLLLGVTATPDRGDGRGLDDLFDEIVWNYDVLWGIRTGYLCELRGLRVTLDQLDMATVKKSRGDYDAGASGRALEDADAPRLAVAAWIEHALGRRTLVFTPTVALAQSMADEFNMAGVSAAWVSGDTPMDERRATLAAYSAGEITVLANCAVLTEGYDEPRTDCIIVARPTRSRALYTQMVGRGTRRHPDKDNCLVLDVVGATAEHSLITVPSLFGVGGTEMERGLSDGTLDLGAAMDDHNANLVKLGLMRAEEAELFHKLRTGAGVAWVMTAPLGSNVRRYQRSLGKQMPTVVLAQRTHDERSWVAGLLMPTGEKRVLIANENLETAQAVGEDYVRKVMHGRSALVDNDAPWRERKPTPKQRAAALRNRIDITAMKTAGEVSDALDAAFALSRSTRPKKGSPT